MSFSPNEPNPYAAPSTVGGFSPAGLTPELSKLVKDFRSQSLALGVIWLIFATLVIVLAVMLTTMELPPEMQRGPAIVGLFAALGLAWGASGVGTLLKQSWGVYFGLALSYLALVGNLISLNLCGLVIIVIILIQAHRVLGFMSKMRSAGLPLTTLP